MREKGFLLDKMLAANPALREEFEAAYLLAVLNNEDVPQMNINELRGKLRNKFTDRPG